MKKTLLLFVALFSINSFSQELSLDYKEYSYTEFFKMIKEEKDSIFKLNNALIRFNEKTDQRFTYKLNVSTYEVLDIDTTQRIVIDKGIELNNVQFQRRFGERINENVSFINGGLYNIHFKKDLYIRNTASFAIYNCILDGNFFSTNFDICFLSKNLLRSYDFFTGIEIHNSKFNEQFVLTKNCSDKNSTLDINIEISNNTFNTFSKPINSEVAINQEFILFLLDNGQVLFNNNKIQTNREALISLLETSSITLNKNEFSFRNMRLSIEDPKSSIEMLDNVFHDNVRLGIDGLKSQDQIDWTQFKNKLISASAQGNLITSLREDGVDRSYLYSKKFNRIYKDSIRYHNKTVYGNEVGLIGTFYNYYKSKYNTEVANEVYLNLKDFETKRLAVLYKQSPSFKTYFTWKVNQFLKVFSAYGTEPARAIIFSLYVILIFAFIYLFFPNTWDVHGKKRIMDRYAFFFTYMNKKAGMHEVYLDNQQEELLEFDEFKTLVAEQGKTVPKFFTATALPLYKWAVSGTKLSATLLKYVDIMKGTWSELPKSKRIWKSTLLISAFLIAVLYDVFIKMLNALMLSINTFTTLGFGEIPIKGLPRYLAIIQGFIGWFMLTIFSVSLISQLLN